MGLNTRSLFDPRFQQAMARPNEAAMTSSVLIRRKAPQGVAQDWVVGEGYTGVGTEFIDLFRGPARVQPNRDLAARADEFADQSTVFQAVSVDVPLLRGEWIADALPREILPDDQVLIESNFFAGLDFLKRFVLIVRNPLVSGNAPQYNMVCDVDLKGGRKSGNP